jgi:hypothetical protein
MAFNEKLADRIREELMGVKKVEEKKMMGGLTFMLKGKMCCGIVKNDLMVRVIESRYEEALSHPHCREMDFTGRPLKGFVFVDEPGFQKKKDLSGWIAMGVEFVMSLPKAGKKRVGAPGKKSANKKPSSKLIKKVKRRT